MAKIEELTVKIKIDVKEAQQFSVDVLQLHACANDLKRSAISKVNQAATAVYVAETITRIAQNLSRLELA